MQCGQGVVCIPQKEEHILYFYFSVGFDPEQTRDIIILERNLLADQSNK
jgi:hypothetical protein